MKTIVYFVQVYTKDGSLTDEFGSYDTYEDAKSIKDFYEDYYKGEDYTFYIVSRKATVIYPRR